MVLYIYYRPAIDKSYCIHIQILNLMNRLYNFVPNCVAITTTFNGTTSLSFMVNDPGDSATYDCWVNSSDHRLHRWTQGNITTVSGLDPGTYYNITCQKRPNRIQTCPIIVAVLATSKW